MTLKVADAPSFTVWFAGSIVTTGGAIVTVNVAAALVSLPPMLLAMQRNDDPLSANTVAGVV